ncbi:ABC transporter ATP-binding protein [Corynebacterium pseudodiphtheriticum]|uniref:ATP-binding cassette domain-containing protein n=1 Tax=Corynebacterium pseudodiphtheriticum TaxID=37637 RepID=A0ABT7FWD7_9CORY|nr:ATP-binding cassette domain-containing protein [Corynebacterium pseudodiphtheriticum]MDC7068179.1 ATP-binding cassette domain-containing protein [Corynebacterium pseudodiphtheriticum]MDC7084244.1 ATP-binding cassette domain-containing protein [Corynebacterium pseudodiphtheriticum]MDC7086021.1 ATP-binding cassette domain-containing protein [Corynebacterium pseudodiphtheriticum]MDK4206200.1 ATP-binding cassette domain-containing protein [Corynebacterium pseudodiphtheriticum]MDK4290301.1 ATP-b
MTELDKSLSAKKSDLGQPVLELRDTSVVFKTRTGSLFSPNKVQANKGINFQIYRNDIVGIVGESGCGKSTLAKVMVGLQKPTSGEVLFKGEQLGWGRSARKQMGESVSVVFQDPATSLNPRMSVQQQLLDPLNVHGVGSHNDRLSRVRELLSLVGLPQSALNVLPRQISGGQRQRVAIARALVLEPDVIIADEPTSALDVSVRAQVLNLLLDLKREMGLGLVFISHDINTVRYVSDRICVMLGGEIVEENTTEEIFGNPQHEYTRELLSAVPSLLGE